MMLPDPGVLGDAAVVAEARPRAGRSGDSRVRAVGGPVPDDRADSGNHSQVLVQRLGGGSPAECFPGPAIERGGDSGEVLGAVP